MKFKSFYLVENRNDYITDRSQALSIYNTMADRALSFLEAKIKSKKFHKTYNNPNIKGADKNIKIEKELIASIKQTLKDVNKATSSVKLINKSIDFLTSTKYLKQTF